MQYQVVVVHEKSGCGGPSSIDTEIQRECNRWASQGFVLVTAYNQQVSVCAGSAVGAVLIFAKQQD